ncbi:MAG: hypothetical protein L0Y74_01155, partial [candidate division Zixibacteria bacterium]|nr:hypothetical protein [candidate division Zixibacteria bacterium]
MKRLVILLAVGSLFTVFGTVSSYAQDPGGVDTVGIYNATAQVDEGFGGQVRVEIMLKTDNTGAGNDIIGVTLPLIITNSNPAANPVLDSSVVATFEGTALESFDETQHNISSNGGDPSIFPLQTVLGALIFPEVGLLAGEHLIATLVFSVADTTTICIDTASIGLSTPNLSTGLGADYAPAWQYNCVQVTSYPAGEPPIIFVGHSPINLIVIDPAGDSIGIDFNTIANAEYHAANDSVLIYSTLPGEYTVKVVFDTADTSEDTTYSVIARVDGYAPAALASNLPVPAPSEVHQVEVTNNPDSGTVSCLSVPGDANSDGILTLSDVISGVNYAFNKSGCIPTPSCWMKGLLCRG